MRFKEIIAETTTSGAVATVATVAMPMGSTQTRGGSLMSGKYTTDLTPNTPKEYKRNKNARGQFKNSISN
jgi:hypothetical protein